MISLKQTMKKNDVELIEITVRDTGSGILKKKVKSLGKISFEKESKLVGVGLTVSNYIAQHLAPYPLSGIYFLTKEGEGSAFTFHIENMKVSTNLNIPIIQNEKSRKLEKINVSMLDSNVSNFHNNDDDLEVSFSKNFDDLDNKYLSNQASKYASISDFKNKFLETSNKKDNADNEFFQSSKSLSCISNDFVVIKKLPILFEDFHDEVIAPGGGECSSTKMLSIGSKFLSLKTFNTTRSFNKKISIITEQLKNKVSQKTCECPDILLVDDNPFNLLALEKVLHPFGLKVETALSGDIAIGKIKNFYENSSCSKILKCYAYKCIFMDIDMPIKDGYQTTNEINEYFKERNFQQIIIPCTAFTDQENILKCQELGMIDFVSKPVNPEVLEKVLEKNVLSLWN